MGAALMLSGPNGQPGGIFGDCSACTGVDASEWLFCLDDTHQPSLPSRSKGGRRRSAKGAANEPWRDVPVQRLEELTKELFKLHDLNGNGVLEEVELIKLNEKIAVLHHGKDTDTNEVRSKYRHLFRTKLDPNGRPVPYDKFRVYAREVLDGLDTDPEAQEMILEQFVAEAQSGRQAFDFALPCMLDQLETPSVSEEAGTDDEVEPHGDTGASPEKRLRAAEPIKEPCSMGEEEPSPQRFEQGGEETLLLDDAPGNTAGIEVIGANGDSRSAITGSLGMPRVGGGQPMVEPIAPPAPMEAVEPQTACAGDSVSNPLGAIPGGEQLEAAPCAQESSLDNGGCPAIQMCGSESSLDENPEVEDDAGPGSLVVESRSVRRAGTGDSSAIA